MYSLYACAIGRMNVPSIGLVYLEHRAVPRLERIDLRRRPRRRRAAAERCRERAGQQHAPGAACPRALHLPPPEDALSKRNWPISFSSTTRRLRLGDAAAVGEHHRVAARVEADVDLAEQPRREDRRDRVLAKLHALVDVHARRPPGRSSGRSARLSTRPTTTPAAFTGARSFRPPMLSNARLHVVRRRRLQRREVAHLQRQEHDRADADRDENADPQVDGRRFIGSRWNVQRALRRGT